MKRLVVLLALLLARPAAADPVWKHGMILPKSDAGIVMMPSRGGFGARQGIDLQTLPLKDDAGLTRALIAGEVDSIEGSPGLPMIAATRGIDLRIIGCTWIKPPYGVFVRDNIKEVADLRGHNFAISAPSAAPDLVARALLLKYGLPRDTIRFADLGGDADRFKAVAAGVADATVISNEYVPTAMQNNMHVLVLARDLVPDFMRFCISATTRTIANRRADLVSFLATEISGLRAALADRDRAIALSHEVTHMPPDDPRPAYIYDDAVRSGSIDPELNVPVAKLAWLQDQLIANGNFTRRIDLATIIDSSLRDEALRQLEKGK